MRSSALRRGAGGTLAVALVLGVLASLLAARPAEARIATIAFAFEHMMPGEHRSQEEALSIPRDARLVDVEITEETSAPGAFGWVAELCPTAGACVPVTPASEGAAIAAGTARLVVEVTLDEGADALATSAISGRLVFADDGGDDGGLPPTGTAVAGLVLGALALLGVGGTLLALSRDRGSGPLVDTGGGRDD